MKLLIYSHFFAPSIGGVETVVLSLARGLAELRDSSAKSEFEITLVTQTPAGNFDDGSLPFRVVRQPSLSELWQVIQECEIVHTAGPALAPLLLALLARKPLVIEHHGFQAICPNGQLFIEPTGQPCPGHFMAERHLECWRCNADAGWLASCKLWLLTFLRRFLCAQAAANVAPTQWLAGLFQLPRPYTSAHGIELAHFSPRREFSSGKPVIAFLGRLVTTKGVLLLFEASRILRRQNRSFELLIIGDGPQRSALEQFARDSQLNVRFAGRLDNQQLEAALAQPYVLVVPSLGGEVFGLVLAENMARALPIIASDLGAFAEVLGDTGLLFHTGDPADLARVLTRLLDDPALAATLGARARARALDLFPSGQMLTLHAAVYRDAYATK